MSKIQLKTIPIFTDKDGEHNKNFLASYKPVPKIFGLSLKPCKQ